ncbi:hypothetical protein BU204_31705 [Actinophytocola xanthii]|uniref:Transglutaminase-like domain-containing protein n=1 Tax=Actinophytocola xanthii TaxID=1912961 RepID=A0A1Q8C7M6_9PSEU|nr:hypothetical protein BU204_31705 [Actinophytocola xanthii]
MTVGRPAWARWSGPVQAVLCTAAAMGGALLYGRFFADTGFLAPLSAAALTGSATAALAGLLRWGPYRTLLLATAGFVLLAGFGVLRGTLEHGLPTRQTAVELARGVFGGWTRMLAVAPPADVRAELLVTPVLLTWAAAFGATTLALRTRSVFAPVVPALVAFVAALLFVGRRPGIQTTAAAVFLVAAFSLVLVRTAAAAGQPRRVTTSRLGFGGPVVVVVALLGVLGGLVLPLASDDQRFDPRAVMSPPVRVTDAITPLARLKSQLREEPPRRLFTVRFAGDARVDRIRVAALDEFDGVTWTQSDRYLVAGHHLPVDPALTRSRTVSARITVEGLDGPFLPAVGWPVRLDNTADVGFSSASGVLLTTRAALDGFTYTVAGEVADRDAGLAGAAPSTAPEHRDHASLSGRPSPVLTAAARQLTATEPTPYGKLVAIERYLRGLPYQLDVPPGHSYAALTTMLRGSGEGYAEQRASAFAVLARALGFPARVAVGYRLPDSGAGAHAVTTREAHAWAEVHFAGYGWVAFEPTGTRSGAPSPAQDPAAAPQPQDPLAVPPSIADRSEVAARQPDRGVPVPRGVALGALAVAVLALLLATSVLTAKAVRRRRRRRTGGTATRVLGAWREATDRLLERGVPVSAALTATEVAERATGALRVAAAPVVRLAPLATAAVYAPEEPDEHAVEEAWELEFRLRRELYPRRFLPRRLAAGLDPRPLLAGWREARRTRRNDWGKR